MSSNFRRLTITHERWPLTQSFTISRGAKCEAETIRVDITQDGLTGRGECVPYTHYGETIQSVHHQINQIRHDLETGLGSSGLSQKMPPGAARNAVDCALWDLESKLTGISAWQKAGLTPSPRLITAFTISLDTPENMAAKAGEVAHYPLLKLKLGAADGQDQERLKAIRNACPRTRLVIDANEGWCEKTVETHLKLCAETSIELVEQPVARESDDILAHINHPVPICADESIHTGSQLAELRGRYDWVNIKLDKTGGLTEGLVMLKKARNSGFGVMVGCMIGTSLAMAPALILAQKADLIDLDGPLWLQKDRENGLKYQNGEIINLSAGLWGSGQNKPITN